VKKIATLLLILLAIFGGYGLTVNPSNLFCSLMLMALLAWLALTAWREEVDQ
jgi:hypothetical protein